MSDPDSHAIESLARRPDLPLMLDQVRCHVLGLARHRLSRLLASREDAEDLAQSVVLELIEHAAELEFRGTKALLALAGEIFMRLASDRQRALRTRKRDCVRELRLPDDDGSDAPGMLQATRAGEDPALLADTHEQVAAGLLRLARLRGREREVVLRRAAGEGHRTIAAALGISEALSQRLLADARRKLRLG
ncbi:MAG: sigma-70 family RNA polymerase sigma factor [Planctomycetes bacterium]|nr:sigma-70 family RNA polymerase sigma factor [Planctomycetota bacterium]